MSNAPNRCRPSEPNLINTCASARWAALFRTRFQLLQQFAPSRLRVFCVSHSPSDFGLRIWKTCHLSFQLPTFQLSSLPQPRRASAATYMKKGRLNFASRPCSNRTTWLFAVTCECISEALRSLPGSPPSASQSFRRPELQYHQGRDLRLRCRRS